MHKTQNLWEPVRRYIWPRIHGILTSVGAYSVTHATDRQYVGTVRMDEQEFEEKLSHEVGFRWNPVASLKREDGRWSEGSWVLRDSDDSWYWLGDPEPKATDWMTDFQLHLTVFKTESGNTEIFAHFEHNWVTFPVKHFKGKRLNPELGVRLTRQLFNKHGINYE